MRKILNYHKYYLFTCILDLQLNHLRNLKFEINIPDIIKFMYCVRITSLYLGRIQIFALKR